MIKKICRALYLAVMITAVVLGITGCNGAKEPAANTAETSENTEADTAGEEEDMITDELTLCGVDYHYRSGTMFGYDRSAHITDKEIVSASFYPWEGQDNYEGDGTELIEIEHQPITAEKWAEIEEAVRDILPILEEYHETFNPFSAIGEAIMLDGGDSFHFILTWRSPDGSEKSVRYYAPNDRRYVTVIDLLMETVHPVGREIIR